MTIHRLKNIYHTIKYLKWQQIVGQISRRIKGATFKREVSCPAITWLDMSIPALDLDEAFISRFDCHLVSKGKIKLLHEEINLDYTDDYARLLTPLLRNNLYYMEYTVALGAMYRKTQNIEYAVALKNIYSRYLKANVSVGSYICALHIPNMIITVSLFGDALDMEFKQKVALEIYSQYQYLKKHLEIHLLANHYLEDLKALVMASFAFGRMEECRKWCKRLEEQVHEQINKDGLNYELSSMYHKIILEDLLRIAQLTKLSCFPKQDWLVPVICKMVDVAMTMENGLGRTPLFNDSGDNVAKPLCALVRAVRDLLGYEAKAGKALPESGYYRLDEGDICVLIDAGSIGPDYQPGHAHCDCLSFEMSLKGRPVFVNAGTMLYQGKKRLYFRSTKAHNTITIGGHEQSICWGEHRVGKRIRDIKVHYVNNGLLASYRNCYGEVHERKYELNERTLIICDSTPGCNDVEVCSYLHIADGVQVCKDGNNIIVGDTFRIIPFNASTSIHTEGELAWYAPEFGRLLFGTCIVFKWLADEESHGYKITMTK